MVADVTRPALAAAPSIRAIRPDDATPAPAAPATTRTGTDQPSRALDGPGRTRGRSRSTLALAVPLALVNSAAIYGQAGWAYERLVASWMLAYLFAGALESVGIYLAAEAHAALMAGDASLRLRLGSYGIGMLVGGLNYWHFAGPHGRPTALAVTFGALSSISPWLWAIRSRSLNRDRLRQLGLVDPRAVRFSPLRWLLYPARTFRAFRAAVWAGVVEPAAAVALAEPPDEPDDADDDLVRLALVEAGRIVGGGGRVNRDTIAAALRSRGRTVSNARAGQLARVVTDQLPQED
jgi:hypothetical protein